MEKKGRIGIPRALMFYRYFPFWKVFFEALGWEVVVSDGMGRKGQIVYFEDSCLPMKLLVTHAGRLAGEADHLFIPRLVSLHPRFILCPKFRGAPDIVRLAIENKTSILDETIDLRTGEHSLQKAFLRIGEKLGASQKESRNSFLEATRSLAAFQEGWINRINRLPTRDLFDLDIPTPDPSCSPPYSSVIPVEAGIQRSHNITNRPDSGFHRGDDLRTTSSHLMPAEGEDSGAEEERQLQVAFIGHPYNLFDTDVNKDVIGLAKQLGMEILTSDLFSDEMIEREISDLSKEIYWSSAREIIGSLFRFLSGGVDGVVFITSFKCGIDALLQEFAKRTLRLRGGSTVPFLVLSFDEHTGREGLTTRLEAFKDVMEARKRSSRHSVIGS